MKLNVEPERISKKSASGIYLARLVSKAQGAKVMLMIVQTREFSLETRINL